MPESLVEPWLRGTLREVDAVPRGVLHALQLAQEDISRWCGALSEQEIHRKPLGLPSIAFQLVHIARSLDRLLTYAEGGELSIEQLEALRTESDDRTRDLVFAEFTEAFERSQSRVRELAVVELSEPRGVGRKQLPTSVGGLLVHIADHTQRHVGQAITTAKVLMAQRSRPRLEL